MADPRRELGNRGFLFSHYLRRIDKALPRSRLGGIVPDPMGQAVGSRMRDPTIDLDRRRSSVCWRLNVIENGIVGRRLSDRISER